MVTKVICLSEKGIFLRDSYYIEAKAQEPLTQSEKDLLLLLSDYQKNGRFSPEKICEIFLLAKNCGAQRKGSLAKKECCYVREIESYFEQTDSGIFQRYRWKGIPREVQSRVSLLAGNRATVYMPDKKVYIFLEPELAALWSQCRDSKIEITNLESYLISLLQTRSFDRELLLKSLWEKDLPLFHLRPGSRERCGKKEPVFYGIPLSGGQAPLLFPYNKYQSLYMENSSSVQALESGGGCFTNRTENLRFVEEVYRCFGKPEQWEDRRFPALDESSWERLEDMCGLCLEGGWQCRVYIEQNLKQRMAFVKEEVRKEDFVILLTDEERVERWKQSFPDFSVYTQRTLEEDFSYKSQEAGDPVAERRTGAFDDKRKQACIFRKQDSFGLFIWDARILSEQNQYFLTFLLRFLPLRQELLFLYPDDTENIQILKKMEEVFFQAELDKKVEQEIRAMEKQAEERKAVLELTFESSQKQEAQLLELLKKQEVPVGIWTETEQRKHSQRRFLDKHFPNQYTEAGKEDGKWIYLVDSSCVYQEALNHYLVFDEEFCAAYKRKIICQGQSRGWRAVICMYHLS